MVECESVYTEHILAVRIVLIDTWWNVNTWMRGSHLQEGLVLIDTWWNVNSVLELIVKWNKYRFNRYMVECELLKVSWSISGGCVLIDTWWNVNINFSGKMAQMSTVLIDTWWNVNYTLRNPKASDIAF